MYLIKNGAVHVGDGTILKDCDILTKGSTIQKIGRGLDCPEAEVVDASGCEVFPGFIDPHSMIGALGIPSRSLDNQEKSDPITPELNVKYSVDPDELNGQEFYKSGITTVGLAPGNTNIMGGQIVVVKTAPMKMSRRIVKEKAALKCSVTASVKSVYGKQNKMPMTRMGSFWMLEEAIRKSEKSGGGIENQERDRVIRDVFDKKKMPVFVAAERIGEIEAADTQLVGQLKQRFSQRYPYQTDILRKNKYSVSELKHRAMREKFEAEQEETIPAFLEEPVTPTIPLFIQRQGIVGQEAQNKAQDAGQEAESKAEQKIESNTANRGALRGTAVHRVMECYDFTSEKSVQEQMDAMEKEEKITADMRALVKEQIVADFVSSETGRRMALAQCGGALYREKPFVMGFTEEEMERYGFGAGAQMIENEAQTENAQQEIMSENVSQENHMHEEDLTLIQGIIDVFWIEDDGITVLDYKTDRVDTAQELIDRYATQLKLYADALERVFATRKLKVKEILIYSFRLEKLISIE